MENSSVFLLPRELKLKIFGHVEVDERQRLRAVCTDWRDVVDTVYGIKIVITNSTSDLVLMSSSAVDVQLCSMTKPFESGIIFANSLQSLTFKSMLVSYNLFSFIRECNGITNLIFDTVTLDIHMNDQWLVKPVGLRLPKLLILEIRCWNLQDSTFDILTFLKDSVEFSVLSEISLTSQNPPTLPLQQVLNEAEDADMHPLIQLVKRNLHSLSKFTLGLWRNPTVIQFHPYGKFRDDPEVISPVQIRDIAIHPYFREEWAPLLSGQHYIQNLRIGSVNVNLWFDVREAIDRNSASIQQFAISGLSFGQVWDCNVFENCLSLQSLALEISHSQKSNLGLLPLQLTYLSIFGPVLQDDLLDIAHRLVNLKQLKLSHLGRMAMVNEADGEKITLTLFKNLLQMPSLTTLSFIVCSSVSLDWSKILAWCIDTASEGLVLDQHFYQLHGQRFRDGLTVRILPRFKRDTIDWSTSENEFDSIFSPTSSTSRFSSISIP